MNDKGIRNGSRSTSSSSGSHERENHHDVIASHKSSSHKGVHQSLSSVSTVGKRHHSRRSTSSESQLRGDRKSVGEIPKTTSSSSSSTVGDSHRQGVPVMMVPEHIEHEVIEQTQHVEVLHHIEVEDEHHVLEDAHQGASYINTSHMAVANDSHKGRLQLSLSDVESDGAKSSNSTVGQPLMTGGQPQTTGNGCLSGSRATMKHKAPEKLGTRFRLQFCDGASRYPIYPAGSSYRGSPKGTHMNTESTIYVLQEEHDKGTYPAWPGRIVVHDPHGADHGTKSINKPRRSGSYDEVEFNTHKGKKATTKRSSRASHASYQNVSIVEAPAMQVTHQQVTVEETAAVAEQSHIVGGVSQARCVSLSKSRSRSLSHPHKRDSSTSSESNSTAGVIEEVVAVHEVHQVIRTSSSVSTTGIQEAAIVEDRHSSVREHTQSHESALRQVATVSSRGVMSRRSLMRRSASSVANAVKEDKHTTKKSGGRGPLACCQPNVLEDESPRGPVRKVSISGSTSSKSRKALPQTTRSTFTPVNGRSLSMSNHETKNAVALNQHTTTTSTTKSRKQKKTVMCQPNRHNDSFEMGLNTTKGHTLIHRASSSSSSSSISDESHRIGMKGRQRSHASSDSSTDMADEVEVQLHKRKKAAPRSSESKTRSKPSTVPKVGVTRKPSTSSENQTSLNELPPVLPAGVLAERQAHVPEIEEISLYTTCEQVGKAGHAERINYTVDVASKGHIMKSDLMDSLKGVTSDESQLMVPRSTLSPRQQSQEAETKNELKGRRSIILKSRKLPLEGFVIPVGSTSIPASSFNHLSEGVASETSSFILAGGDFRSFAIKLLKKDDKIVTCMLWNEPKVVHSRPNPGPFVVALFCEDENISDKECDRYLVMDSRMIKVSSTLNFPLSKYKHNILPRFKAYMGYLNDFDLSSESSSSSSSTS